MKYFFYKSKDGECAVKIGEKGEMIAVSPEVFEVLEHTQWIEEKTAQRHPHNELDETNLNSQCRIDVKSPESLFIQREYQNELCNLITENCSREELELLSEVALNGRTVTDYAEKIGIPRSTLQSRKTALYNKLQKILKGFR